ncbi:Protein kinase of the Mitotic Exit Network, variant 2 [Balamuthia mandrillaris]
MFSPRGKRKEVKEEKKKKKLVQKYARDLKASHGFVPSAMFQEEIQQKTKELRILQLKNDSSSDEEEEEEEEEVDEEGLTTVERQRIQELASSKDLSWFFDSPSRNRDMAKVAALMSMKKTRFHRHIEHNANQSGIFRHRTLERSKGSTIPKYTEDGTPKEDTALFARSPVGGSNVIGGSSTLTRHLSLATSVGASSSASLPTSPVYSRASSVFALSSTKGTKDDTPASPSSLQGSSSASASSSPSASNEKDRKKGKSVFLRRSEPTAANRVSANRAKEAPTAVSRTLVSRENKGHTRGQSDSGPFHLQSTSAANHKDRVSPVSLRSHLPYNYTSSSSPSAAVDSNGGTPRSGPASPLSIRRQRHKESSPSPSSATNIPMASSLPSSPSAYYFFLNLERQNSNNNSNKKEGKRQSLRPAFKGKSSKDGKDSQTPKDEGENVGRKGRGKSMRSASPSAQRPLSLRPFSSGKTKAVHAEQKTDASPSHLEVDASALSPQKKASSYEALPIDQLDDQIAIDKEKAKARLAESLPSSPPPRRRACTTATTKPGPSVTEAASDTRNALERALLSPRYVVASNDADDDERKVAKSNEGKEKEKEIPRLELAALETKPESATNNTVDKKETKDDTEQQKATTEGVNGKEEDEQNAQRPSPKKAIARELAFEKTTLGKGDNAVELICKIGKGSQATVWKGTLGNALVALKQISLERVKNKRALRHALKAEVEMMKQLSHPNLLTYYGMYYSREDQEIYLVMELMEGGTLSEIVKRHEKLPEYAAAQAISQVVRALAHLREHKVIHRDIKPDNMLVSADGAIKLCDFGESTRVNVEVCRRSTVGTPWYAAPEIINGDEYSYPSDIWSVGCSLLELLTGVRKSAKEHSLNLLHSL